jgi:hypothetical protein
VIKLLQELHPLLARHIVERLVEVAIYSTHYTQSLLHAIISLAGWLIQNYFAAKKPRVKASYRVISQDNQERGSFALTIPPSREIVAALYKQ